MHPLIALCFGSKGVGGWMPDETGGGIREIPDVRAVAAAQADHVKNYLLCHQHTAKECPVAFAAWKGFDSPLRHQPTLGSCPTGGHMLWWEVEAQDAASALAFLPPYVADRTEAVAVRPVEIP